MSAADWYARKLGGTSRQQPRTSTPPLQQGAPAVPVYVPPYQPASPQSLQKSPQQVAPGPPVGKEAVLFAIFNRPEVWQGRGPSAKAGEVHACPNCGSAHFFTRAGMGGVMGMPPAPMCDSCGYNGRFEQFGSRTDEA